MIIMQKGTLSLIAIIIYLTYGYNSSIAQNKIKDKMESNSLTPQQEKIVTISAFTAKGDLKKLKPELTTGLNTGLTVNEIKEIIVQSYAYCGFPRAIRGLQTLMEVLDERKEKGINDNFGREASPIVDTHDKYDRGKAILAKLQNTPVPKGRPTSGYSAFSPEIDTFLKEHLFADVFERDVLTYAQREMVTVSILMALDGVEPMLNSHMNLALNVGISPNQIQEMIQIIENNIGKENANVAKSELTEVLKSRNQA